MLIHLRLNPLDKQPLYLQIVEQVEEAVHRAELSDGQALWSARKIAAHYQISYQTAERALAALAQRGVVRRSVAAGTVVIGREAAPLIRHRVVALISCWEVWGARPTYTMAEMQMWQAAAHELTRNLWGMLSLSAGSGDGAGFSVAELANWRRNVRFDGALVFGNMPEEGLEWLSRQGYGLVVVDYEPQLPLPRVVHDNYGGMRQAVERLLALEHRRIAYLYGDRPYHYGVRLQAYRDALRDAGVTPDPDLTVCVRSAGPTVAETLDRWLEAPAALRPTAVAAGSDILAALVVKHLEERGLRVPDAFSLTGYDDEPFAPMMTPPLSTLHVSWDDMGRAAARMLLELLAGRLPEAAGPAGSPPRLVTPARWIERASAQPIIATTLR